MDSFPEILSQLVTELTLRFLSQLVMELPEEDDTERAAKRQRRHEKREEESSERMRGIGMGGRGRLIFSNRR